jgi:hypothetical protein
MEQREEADLMSHGEAGRGLAWQGRAGLINTTRRMEDEARKGDV